MDGNEEGRTHTTRVDDLLDAALAHCGEFGYRSVSAEEVVRRCGVGPDIFNRHFTGPQECLERAYEREAERLLRRLLPPTGDPARNVARALEELTAFIAEDSLRARAVLLEARSVGGPPFQRRQEYLKRLGDALDATCRQEGERRAPTVAGIFLVGGIEEIAIQALRRNRPEAFSRDIPALLFLIGRTYELPALLANAEDISTLSRS